MLLGNIPVAVPDISNGAGTLFAEHSMVLYGPNGQPIAADANGMLRANLGPLSSILDSIRADQGIATFPGSAWLFKLTDGTFFAQFDGDSKLRVNQGPSSSVQDSVRADQGVATFPANGWLFKLTDGALVAQLDAAASLRVNTEGQLASYSASIVGLVPPAAATDIFTIVGSANKVIRVTRLVITGTQTTGGVADVLLIKRSALNTSGTSTAPTPIPLDSNDAPATAVLAAYTVNPGGLGASVGMLASEKLFVSATTAQPQRLDLLFGVRNGKAVTLRSATQLLAVNLNGATYAGNLFNITVEWTEALT